MLINSTRVSKLAKQVSQLERRGKFTRVSKSFLMELNATVTKIVTDSVRNHPTCGKTITELYK